VRVLHAHQYESLVTNLVVLAARATGRPAFATDLGGGGANVSRALTPLLSGMLALSEFATSFYPELAARTRVIGGGVDVERFRSDGGPRRREVVYVGRLLPHKGIDVLIEAMPPDVPLRVCGRTLDPAYRELLGRLAHGKQVIFEESPTDAQVLDAYRRARVAVLPSVEHSPHRDVAPKSELLGLVLLEAMACGTPVVCARTGPMPEIVREGETGYVVPPNDAGALGQRIRELLDGGRRWDAMSEAGAAWVRSEHTWDRVAQRALRAYDELG
jgi:glycosyltransferase involved in cell wall biosynthesis